jgi:hypothetical protein
VQDFPNILCAPINQSTESIQSGYKHTSRAAQMQQKRKAVVTNVVAARPHANAFINACICE